MVTPAARAPFVLIHGYYGFSNAGDEAILSALIARLRRQSPGVEICVLSGDPAGTSRRHSVRAVSAFDAHEMTRAAAQADVVILGGGGLFQDYWGFDPDTLLTPSASGMSFFMSAKVLAQAFRKPLVLYAVGAGPFYSQAGRDWMRQIADAAALITVRDEGSRQELLALGVVSERIHVTSDPAFDLTPSAPPQPETGSPKIAVSLRRWSHNVHQPAWEREVTDALDRLHSETGASFLFLPFDTLPNDPDPDKDVLRRVRERMTSGAAVEEPEQPCDFSELHNLIAGCSLVIGMRLHSLVFAATAGVPFVGVSYDPKVTAIFQVPPYGAYLHSLQDLCAEGIVRSAVSAMQNREALRTALRAFVPPSELRARDFPR